MRSDRYSEYCQEHVKEFRDELRDEASLALSGWFGKAAALLLIVISVMTYDRLNAVDSPYAINTLFTYAVPVLLLLLFPIISLVYSKFEKFSPAIVDIICLSTILGFCLTLKYVFAQDLTLLEQSRLYMELSGQINFTILMTTAFSYHTSFRLTFIRNSAFTMVCALFLFTINPEFLQLNSLQVIEGFMAGIIFTWIFFLRIQTRFYYKSIDADTRQHLYKQLSKLVYPHQLALIKAGEQLEDTMPVDRGQAIINVFDIQKSSDIRHEKTKTFLLDIFRAFSQICMMGYQHNPLKSRAFRLKETGDGFISSIGYPFLTDQTDSLADHAIETALIMLRAFNSEVIKFNYTTPIKASMGMAFNSAQGTFQSSGIKSYDLYGEALVQAYRYEEIRKHSIIEKVIREKAHSLGLAHFNILIIQEVIYNALSPHYRSMFEQLDLRQYNFQIRQDIEATFVYFHVRE